MEYQEIALESVEIIGLFNRPAFTLHLDQDRPTILTGANGTGKSTILRVISALSNGDVVTLASAPLERLVLNIRGLPRLVMTRVASGGGFDLEWGDHRGRVEASPRVLDLPEWAAQVLEESDFDITEALDRISDVASSSGVPFPEYAVARDSLRAVHADGPVVTVPEWLSEFGLAFPVLFVSDQRLVTERQGKRRARGTGQRQRTSSLAVESAAFEISEQIEKAFSNYGRTSQQLDRSFPEKLILAMSGHSTISTKRLNSLVDAVERKRETLRQVGLLEQDEHGPNISPAGFDDESLRTVMEAVLNANLQKLDVFDDLERRLSSFKAFLDNRFVPKQLVLSRGEGMRFTSTDGQVVRARQLSSGEQQMTVLAYEILFRAKPNTLVIVDEPELSLHVLWQDSLVDDLTRMGDISGLQFLMATHSPTIIAEHPELERALSGL
jgi:ABC-type transport system involved in cytochrome c biogenesis ATPase subunit